MDNPAQFYVSLGAQILIGIVGIYYQHQQLRHMLPQSAIQPRTFAFARHWPLIVMVLCGVMAWAPLVIRPHNPQGYPETSIEDFGLLGGPFTFSARLNTAALMNYKTTHNLFMIVRFQYANIDRMSDTGIEKSAPYTIDGMDLRMSVVGKLDPPHLRIEPKNPNVSIEYDVAILPKEVSLDRVSSIADVERLGGRILSATAQTVPFDALDVKIVPRE